MSIRLDHINISVHSLSESVKWYGDLFGFNKVEEGINHYGRRWAIVACEDSLIAMTEYDGRKPADSDFEVLNHQINHFGIRVPDAQAWCKKIEKFSLALHYGGEVRYPHSTSWYVHDPSGHEIEVSCTGGTAMRFPPIG
jgi:catechol 2,3-dioxygenase-like lactoylglutathione lyase family enzyme